MRPLVQSGHPFLDVLEIVDIVLHRASSSPQGC